MGADDARATPCRKPPAPCPALLAVRGRSRSRVADPGACGGGAALPDTPPRRSPVTVPFLWEDAPGKPKPPPTAGTAAAANAGAGCDRQGSGHADGKYHAVPLKLPPRLQQVPPPTAGTPAAANAGAGCDRQDGGHADAEYQARSVPLKLKLPPRLQHVPSFPAADTPPVSSPKTVLQGPYYGCAGAGGWRPPRWARTPSAGVGLFSRTWSRPKAAPAHERDSAGPDAPWCSPASSSSSSSVSTWFAGDDHGGRVRPSDGREVSSEEEENGSPRGSVRITRFRRNRSLPSMTTSNLWASIRRSVKQITVWS